MPRAAGFFSCLAIFFLYNISLLFWHLSHIVKHALKNALIPVATALGLRLGFLLGGAMVVE
jgi:hypothetical protein